MSYSIYRRFGRVIEQKEWDAILKLAYASWYEKPYYKFIIWKEKCKRWLKADIHLKGDNPFTSCLFWIIIIICIFIIICFIKF